MACVFISSGNEKKEGCRCVWLILYSSILNIKIASELFYRLWSMTTDQDSTSGVSHYFLYLVSVCNRIPIEFLFFYSEVSNSHLFGMSSKLISNKSWILRYHFMYSHNGDGSLPHLWYICLIINTNLWYMDMDMEI